MNRQAEAILAFAQEFPAVESVKIKHLQNKL